MPQQDASLHGQVLALKLNQMLLDPKTLIASAASQLVYKFANPEKCAHIDEAGLHKLLNPVFIKKINAHPAYAYIHAPQNINEPIIAAVAGTNDARDWATNLNIIPFPEHTKGFPHGGFYTAQFFPVVSQENKSSLPFIRKLSGHKKTLQSDMFEALEQLLSTNPQREVIFTGHSMGAGVTTHLAEAWKSKHPESQVRIIAFAPPPMNDLAAHNVQDRIGKDNILYIYDSKDILPKVPSILPGYCIIQERQDNGSLIYTIRDGIPKDSNNIAPHLAARTEIGKELVNFPIQILKNLNGESEAHSIMNMTNNLLNLQNEVLGNQSRQDTLGELTPALTPPNPVATTNQQATTNQPGARKF